MIIYIAIAVLTFAVVFLLITQYMYAFTMENKVKYECKQLYSNFMNTTGYNNYVHCTQDPEYFGLNMTDIRQDSMKELVRILGLGGYRGYE